MEGYSTGFKMPSLTQADLTVPLSRVVKEKHPSIDLLVGVVDKKEAGKFSEVGVPLAVNLGYDLRDACCIFLYQLALNKWEILTTHGNAEVLTIGNNFEVKVRYNYQTPQETPILRQLIYTRNKLLSQGAEDAPYPKIRGKILLCGDFAIWKPIVFLGLREIFIANGARDVIFATPVLESRNCRRLEKEGCNIIRLHPPEERTEWLMTQANV